MSTIIHYTREFWNIPGIFRSLFRYRELIQSLTVRDFRARFQGSVGGALWSIVQPLVMMAIYTLVFSVFLKVRFGVSDSPFMFAIYLLCGILPWSAFAEGLTGSTGVIRGNTNFVKRVVFPLEVLPLNLVLVALINQTIGFLLLLPLTWLVVGQAHWTIVFVPLLMIIQAIFYIGIFWIWSSLAVYLPDLSQFTALLISALSLLTPIYYPENIIPSWAQLWMKINPFARLVSMYRQMFIDGVLPSIEQWLIIGAFSGLVFLLGYFWFSHTKKGFADIL